MNEFEIWRIRSNKRLPIRPGDAEIFKAGMLAAAAISDTHVCTAGVNNAISFDIRTKAEEVAP